jgi:hypothetical protein
MTEFSRPDEAIQAWRDRSAAYVRGLQRDGWNDDGTRAEIDVYDLLGVKGKIPPTPAELVTEAEAGEETPNTYRLYFVMGDSDLNSWLEKVEEADGMPPYMVERTRRLLGDGPLAGRAEEAVEPVCQILDGMREPLRTVGLLSVFGVSFVARDRSIPPSPEELAGSFGTSVETMEWLRDVAMDMLSAQVRVTFQS